MMMTIGGPMASKKRTKKGRPKARIASASISADTLKAFYKDMSALLEQTHNSRKRVENFGQTNIQMFARPN